MRFNLPTEKSSIIKVIGVGGGGGNAVNHMFNMGIKGVDFIVCNTDHQALDTSPVPIKVQLGSSLTEGRGAGSIPEIGKNAAIENIDDIQDFLADNTKMVFVTAGMGGGTGTGAAPVIARIAKEMGVLTVGIVTMPFAFEGRKRKEQAAKGLEEMRNAVDTLLVINNDRLREMYGNLSLQTAFGHADDVLTTAAKGIAEVISVTGAINVDFNDVNTVMKDSGVAIMGQASASGEDRAIEAVKTALSSPLLNDNDIAGAKYVLLNITYGDQEVLMDEISDITDYIQDEAGSTADVIWGHGYDDSLSDGISVTIIATGFNSTPDTGVLQEPEQKVYNLEKDNIQAKPITEQISSPMSQTNTVEPAPQVEEVPEPYLKAEDDAPVVPTPVDNTWNEEPALEDNDPWKNSTNSDLDEPVLKQQPTAQPEPSNDVKKFSLDDDYVPEGQTPSTAPTDAWNEEPVAETKWDAPQAQWQTPNVTENQKRAQEEADLKDQQRIAQERLDRLKNLSAKLKSPSGLSDLENEPAYKRRSVNLDEVPHSSESNVSKFTLSEEEGEDGEKRTGLRENNSFLHDNVD